MSHLNFVVDSGELVLYHDPIRVRTDRATWKALRSAIFDEREEGRAGFHKFHDMVLLSLHHLGIDVLSRN